MLLGIFYFLYNKGTAFRKLCRATHENNQNHKVVVVRLPVNDRLEPLGSLLRKMRRSGREVTPLSLQEVNIEEEKMVSAGK